MILVYLGPTLSIEEAKTVLPEACYMPPVKCGDIMQAIRLKPKTIVIIDGVFERSSAVWHKEILFALEQGVVVIGAASMGALRAAELSRFGMVGVGKIYEAYANESIIDDDEVAVLHKDFSQGFSAITNAMVDIRLTLEKACDEKRIDNEEKDRLISAIKNKPYQERELRTLVKWCEGDVFVSQKKTDAIAALHLSKQGVSSNPDNVNVSHTAYLKTLAKMISTKPFSVYQPWLPIHEKVAMASRLFPKDYPNIKRLARLLACYRDINPNFKASDIKYDDSYAERLDELVFMTEDKPDNNIVKLSAYIWGEVLAFINEKPICLEEHVLANLVKQFKAFHGMNDEMLDDKSLANKVRHAFYFDYYVKNNNLNVSFCDGEVDQQFWLNEALVLSGFYNTICQQLSTKQGLNNLLSQMDAFLEKQHESALLALDFDGRYDFTAYSKAICCDEGFCSAMAEALA